MKAEKYIERAKYHHSKMRNEWNRVCGPSVDKFMGLAKEREVKIGISVANQALNLMKAQSGSFGCATAVNLDKILEVATSIPLYDRPRDKIKLFCDTEEYKKHEKKMQKAMKKYYELVAPKNKKEV